MHSASIESGAASCAPLPELFCMCSFARLVLTVAIVASAAPGLHAGTVTYDISSIASPTVYPTGSTPQSFARGGSASGYSYYTMGSAYLSGADSAMSVSSWTHVVVDLSRVSQQTLESAWLQLRVR